MALFTDGSITSIDALRAFDSAILRVANAEGVDLDAKQQLASTEIGIAIEEFLVRRTGLAPSGDAASGQSLRNVVVTPPLRQWHTLLTLTLIYGDIEGNHVGGRYGEKAKEYQRRANWSAETLFRVGVGLTYSPVERAQPPLLRTIAGADPVATYHVQVAWRNRAGESGAPSEQVIYTTESDGVVGVQAVDAPEGVLGFDVYLGTSAEEVFRQNADPIDPEAEWVMPAGGPVAGAEPGEGQLPDRYVRNDRILQRG